MGKRLELAPGTDLEGAVVEARLGEGGYGTVFRVRRAGQRYAAKLLVKKLRVVFRSPHSAEFLGVGKKGNMPVYEGWTNVRLVDDAGGLETGTTLSGRLIFAERVYLRLTQARTEDGTTYPICFEGWAKGGGRGLSRKDKGGGTTATVFSHFNVVAVRRFE